MASSQRLTPMTGAERQRRYRQNKAARLAALIQGSALNSHLNLERDNSILANWSLATLRFQKYFYEDEFGHVCDVCDRIWFGSDLTEVNSRRQAFLESKLGTGCASYKLCSNCRQSIDNGKFPPNSKINGFYYPEKPHGLPELNPVMTRLISPRIPFMSIQRLAHNGQYSILGQVINIPVDVNTMVNSLPRQLDDDYAINVSIKRSLLHKSTYLKGTAKKSILRSWLTYLVQQPLYQFFRITINHAFLETFEDGMESDFCKKAYSYIDSLDPNDESEQLSARQQTLLYNEDHIVEIAPGAHSRPLNIIFDNYAEELSFPHIYYGHARSFKQGVRVTPYMIANSEVRRRDRRGVCPDHILYMAMKIIRLRIIDHIRASFRCIQATQHITRGMIEDRDFLNDCLEKNFAFLKSIPNSMNYWHARKQDLFAMLRQLGKPTIFLTMSANEMNWPHLLKMLYFLQNGDRVSEQFVLDELDKSSKANLVNNDPVGCALYFNKFVTETMKLLTSKKSFNPFGKNRVIDSFIRIEFQHRGSPHAHILLWLDNAPNEPVSDNMSKTIQFITDLCSVSKDDIPEEMYKNQVHRHTFTCTKRGEASCRFNIPYWPIKETRVLAPLPGDFPGKNDLAKKAVVMKRDLEHKIFDSLESFLSDHQINYEGYLNVIRSTLTREKVCFKRDMTEIMTNTFHPWIARTLNSNMDIQFILDEHSCASYVVDYINKSNRGMSKLHRELSKLQRQYPELDQEQLLRKLGQKIINTIELSGQEAAWFLLRLPMSQASREVVFIPTFPPEQRQKSYKTKTQLDKEKIDSESTDIWTKSIIQHYEDRPAELEHICLADFAAWYRQDNRSATNKNTESALQSDGDNNFPCDQFVGLDDGDQPNTTGAKITWAKRTFPRVIRYRNYSSSKPETTRDHKREMVLLFLPFRNELCDVLDRDKFLSTYETRLHDIASKRQEYESGIDIEKIIEEFMNVQHCSQEREETIVKDRNELVREVVQNGSENFDDFESASGCATVSAVRSRQDIMPKSEYCRLMRTTNVRQREFILEFIHRLTTPGSEPIQVFFTGPAGCGKTYVLKLVMETINRFTTTHDRLTDSFIACASTGKAAVGLGGTTVHSAFQISTSLRQGSLAGQSLYAFRNAFSTVSCVIIDEVSMIGSHILYRVDQRLQQITGKLNTNFGGMHMIFCGDFHQLPPVRATPVYKGSRNHIEGASLWQSLNFFPLNEVMRQADKIFSSLLTKIGSGLALTMSESQLIESRFVTAQWSDENLPKQDVPRLYFSNASVDSYNNRAIPEEGSRICVAHDEISGYTSAQQKANGHRIVHRMLIMESGGLPYILRLHPGFPYMLTSNIDVQDGLVNGSIGVLRYIEDLHVAEEDSQDQPQLRVWIEFDSPVVGSNARLKKRPVIESSNGMISHAWTPIAMKRVNIELDKRSHMKCRRTQFPITAACAITIHKSQGGTFERAVYLYDKTHPTELVYVALSRIKSIDGLYLISSDNSKIFHHKKGRSSPAIREITEEYSRLSQHPLETLSTKVDQFLSAFPAPLLICTINAQSIVAHSGDISTDNLLNRSDILIITETWMNSDNPVPIDGYALLACENSRSRSLSNHLSDIRRLAGGVAIYVKSESIFVCESLPLDLSGQQRIQDTDVDLTLISIDYAGQFRLTLAAIYVHCGTSKSNLELFLSHALSDYSNTAKRMNPSKETDTEGPLIISGDFNTNIQDNKSIVQFMKREFNLDYVPIAQSTTIRNTTIDLTFVRNLQADCLPYIAYFSDHRPIFTRIVQGGA